MSGESALDIPDNAACAFFCDYLSGRRPFTVAARTDEIAVLVTREQRGLPHLLVVPTTHRETIVDLRDSEVVALAIGVRAAARAIDDATSGRESPCGKNNGIPANQTIAHVHFHVAGTLPPEFGHFFA